MTALRPDVERIMRAHRGARCAAATLFIAENDRRRF